MNNEENTFSHNEGCPRCTAKGNDKAQDNLGVYHDGHAHCWSCNFYRPSTINSRFRVRASTKIIKTALPDDCTTEYPDKALEWVNQYGFTRKDLLINNVLWSDKGNHISLKKVYTACSQQLIFPFWGKGDLFGYLGRYFGGVKGIPKWLTRGKMQEIYHIMPGSIHDKSIVLTEALISAIKVSKAGHESMPILGSHAVGRYRHLKLLGYTTVILWLDPDKHTEMLRQSRVGALEGLTMRVVLSTKKPKEHSYSEIKEYLK